MAVDVKHSSHVKHWCLFTRNTGERETQFFCLMSTVVHVQQFACRLFSVDTCGQGWTAVYVFFAMFWMKHGSQRQQCMRD